MDARNTPVCTDAVAGQRTPAQAASGVSPLGDMQVRSRNSGSALVGNPYAIGFQSRSAASAATREMGWITRTAKRLVDIVGAVVGLIVFAPVMLITAIIIKLDDRGAVLFRQERVGKEGKRFLMLKFRTMAPDAEDRKIELIASNDMSGPVFKMRADPRITRVGRTLRKFSIDELPQFLHVLTGELSLVGPRPALPEEVEKYEPHHRPRLAVKPGLTCLWQVNGRNELDFEDWMRLDLEYVERRSLWLDARILARTIPTVLKGTGV